MGVAPQALVSLPSGEPHRMNPNGFVVALEARPAEWFATSHDGTTRLMFYGEADPFPPPTADIPISERATCSTPKTIS
jgi:hypothetical protein